MNYGTGLDRKSFGETCDQRQGHNRYRAPVERKYACHVRPWDNEKVILRDEVIEVRNVNGRLHIARKPRRHDEWTRMSRPTIRVGQGRA